MSITSTQYNKWVAVFVPHNCASLTSRCSPLEPVGANRARDNLRRAEDPIAQVSPSIVGHSVHLIEDVYIARIVDVNIDYFLV